MRVKQLYITTALLALGTTAFAQARKDTVIKGTTIEVIQSYKPEVKMAPKKEYVATPPPADTSRPRFSYEVPQQALFYTYSSLPLRPLALGKDSLILPFANYVKAGFGNLGTVYIDAGFGGLKGTNYETAIRLHHLSQKGDIEHQKTASSGVNADGTYHSANHDWHASLLYNRSQFGYFGYDHSLYEYTNRDSVTQVFNLFRVGVDMQPRKGEYRTVTYHPGVTFSSYSDNHNASETSFGFNAPFFYNLDSIQFEVGLSGVFTQLNVSPFVAENNNMLQINPGMRFSQNGFSGHVYLRPTFGKDNSYLLPDLRAAYIIPNSQFVIAAGYQSNLRRNTYEELSTYNPYMFNLFSVQQTRTDEIYGSVQTNVGNHINFGAKVSWWNYNHLPLFLNDSLDQKQFYIVHDKVNAISFQANLRYQVNTTLSIGVNAMINGFTPDAQKEVWHEPGVRFNADFILRPVPELTITGYLAVVNGIKAYNIYDQTVNTRGVFDLGAGVEYNFIPRLSAFINVNNMLNNKYERWLGYNSYGFNIYGGLRLKF